MQDTLKLYRGLIYDLDQTLADNAQWMHTIDAGLIESFFRTRDFECAKNPYRLKAYCNSTFLSTPQMRGKGFIEKVQTIAEEMGIETDGFSLHNLDQQREKQQIEFIKTAQYRSFMSRYVYQDVWAALDAQNKAGIKLAIASSNEQEKLEQLCKASSLAPFFNDRIFGANQNRRLKPEKDIPETALKAMDLDVSEVAFVGDSLSDLGAAQKLGMDFYAINRNPNDPDFETAMRLHGVENIIYQISDLTP